MSKSFDQIANSFHKAEKNMQIGGPGVGGYDVDVGNMKPVLGVKKPQSPAQHASVEKAGRTSAAKRKAGAGFGGKSSGKVFGF
jgi:hypothetical protein